MAEQDLQDGSLLTDDPAVVDTQDLGSDEDTQEQSTNDAEATEGKRYADKYDSVEDLEKGYKELETYRGQSVRLPGENASDEERAEFNKKLGVPDAPDGYELDGTKQTPETIAAMKEIFHKLDLRPAQAEGLLAAVSDGTLSIQGTNGVAPISKSAALKDLAGAWGTEFKTQLAGAQQAAVTHGGDDFKKLLKDAKLGNHPVMLKFLASVGETLSEDTLLIGESNEAPTAPSLATIFETVD